MAAITHPKQIKMQPWEIRRRRRQILTRGAITMLALSLLLTYFMPFGYLGVTSLKTRAQSADPDSPILPYSAVTFEYGGTEYDLYQVPTEDGFQEWALFKKGRESSEFLDPNNLEAGPIAWDGRWRQLDRVRALDPTWTNYGDAWEKINFPLLLRNTLGYALITMVAAVSSAAVVAYGFARFNFPLKNILFIILLATIILPTQVTLVPTYAFYVRINWIPGWLPLIIPTFFSNGFNVFLLRQYFLTIPQEMEEAAKIDGAGPFRTLWSVILPQAIPALVAVSLFHFFFAWNDFFGPLIYLAGRTDLNPISVGLTRFNNLFGSQPNLIMATSLMTIVIPLTIFFIAQRFFIQGVVITGVDK